MRGPKWILLAEDTPYDADLAIRVLSADQFPCEVQVVQDGLEALDCLYCRKQFKGRAGGHPSLILLDLKMPRVDGLEVLRQLKTDSELKSIPVVVFTSSREVTDLVRSYQLGANAYVVKPVDFQQYTKALKAVRTFWMATNELAPPATAPDFTLVAWNASWAAPWVHFLNCNPIPLPRDA